MINISAHNEISDFVATETRETWDFRVFIKMIFEKLENQTGSSVHSPFNIICCLRETNEIHD